MENGVDLDDAGALTLAPALPAGLCDACLGRCFAKLGHGLENADRGRRLREATGLAASSGLCTLCEGISGRVDFYARLAIDAAGGIEFRTFLVGSKFFVEIGRREGELWKQLLSDDAGRLASRLPPAAEGSPPWPGGEWLKNEVNRGVGRRLESALGVRADLRKPELVITIDTRVDRATADPMPVFISGRYRKLDRTIPQTRWPCRSCNGLGCRRCGGVGKLYPTSVEEEVGGPALELLAGSDHAFHGMGREDIDARMLGTGRPFVLEIKSPRRRGADLALLARRVNDTAKGRVEVEGLVWADGSAAARFKAAEPPKTYRARCRAEAVISPEKLLKTTGSLGGLLLDQRTPERVAHRRADRVRQRRIRRIEVVGHDGDRFDLEIEAEAGTYIKEFVSGDQGRTSPSLAERLGVPVKVEELDVVAVHWKE